MPDASLRIVEEVLDGLMSQSRTADNRERTAALLSSSHSANLFFFSKEIRPSLHHKIVSTRSKDTLHFLVLLPFSPILLLQTYRNA